jgi:ABC-type multidrug transport system fused ATPase/permease subunit
MAKIKIILSILNKREKRQLVLIFLVLLMMGFIELAGVGSISPFITVISNAKIIHTNTYLSKVYAFFNFSSDTSFIIAFGIAVIAVLVLSNVFLSLITFIIYYYSAKRCYSISMRLYERYLRQPYIFYLNVNTADLSRNILGDIPTYVNQLLVVLLQIVSNSIISLSIIILLIIINPIMALAISAVLIAAYFLIFTFVRNFLLRRGKERNLYNSLKYKCINETFGGIKDIKILGMEQVFLNQFSVPLRRMAINDSLHDVINDMPKYLLESVAFSGILGIIIFMISSGKTIESFFPVLSVYIFGAYRLLPTLQKLFKGLANIRYHFPSVENLYRDFNNLPQGEALSGEDIPKMEFQRQISLKDIRFSYPNTAKEVIKSQSIVINHNTSIAFVGATGCGKTTLVDIILGLLEPQGGKIFIDDTEITGENRKSWQKNLGYVPQSIYLTDDTIRRNIAFGIAPEAVDGEAVIKAAQTANIHDFIVNETEKGYDTVVGERGIRLSGGQRQRIGIARAVYHDPSVLILDEATSALDGLTENAIIDAINNLNHKKTIIMIAHRITTVKYCDLIYLMDNGRITDYGRYEELYERNESFKKMADGVYNDKN